MQELLCSIAVVKPTKVNQVKGVEIQYSYVDFHNYVWNN